MEIAIIDAHPLFTRATGRPEMRGKGKENVAAVVPEVAQDYSVVYIAAADGAILKLKATRVDHV